MTEPAPWPAWHLAQCVADAAFAWVVLPELNALAHNLILILFSQILQGLTLDDETYLPLLEKLIGETEFLQV